MQNKRLGKHNFGLADNLKARGKEKGTVGATKVYIALLFVQDSILTKSLPKAVCVTACGNFAVAGSSAGQIFMWNLQSGIQRKKFILGTCPPDVVARTSSSERRGRSICGLATDSLNRALIACTVDGTVNVRFTIVVIICHSLPGSSSIFKQQN